MYAWRKTTMAALGGCLLLTLGLPAHAQAATGASVADARLLAKGAAVAVTMTFSCPAGFTGSVGMDLRQKVSSGQIATGTASTYTTCAGDGATTIVTALPTGTLAFKVGVAEATGSLFMCEPNNFFNCVSAHFTQEVRIHN
jgi:hypothetical protein